jgi:hypothetical protein
MRKKKPLNIGAVNNKIQRLSRRRLVVGRVNEAPPGNARVKQVTVSAERKPPSSGLH